MNERIAKLRGLVAAGLQLCILAAGANAAMAADATTGEPIVLLQDQRLKTSFGPPARILENGIAPYLFRTPNGTLVVYAQLPLPKGYKRPAKDALYALPGTAVSRDGGETWKSWSPAPSQGLGSIMEGCVGALSDGSVVMLDMLADTATAPKAVGKRWVSTDDWASVQGPLKADIVIPHLKKQDFDDQGHPCSSCCLHRSLVELPGGDLVAPAYGWLEGDDAHAEQLSKSSRCRSFLIRSKDKGRTWSFVSSIAYDPEVGTEGFDEPALARLEGQPHAGRFLCLMRTGRELYQAFSDDDGKSWSKPTPVQFPGIDIRDTKKWAALFKNLPAEKLPGNVVDPDLKQLKNGLLVCSFGVRIPARDCWPNASYERNGNYIAFSLDQGVSWSHIVQITSGVVTVHYTSVCEIGPGELYVTYDTGDWGSSGRCVLGRKIKVSVAP